MVFIIRIWFIKHISVVYNTHFLRVGCQVTQLSWDFFGNVKECRPGLRRKFVGTDPAQPRRRDFVRIKGEENNTCLTAELIMFVIVSGFVQDPSRGFVLTPEFRNTPSNSHDVQFALVRWLSPHADTLVRDVKLRPIGPAPLDINHALWTYARRPARRDLMGSHNIFYEGATETEREHSLESESHAFFDLIRPDAFVGFVNCTPINTVSETDTILETITIPFNNNKN